MFEIALKKVGRVCVKKDFWTPVSKISVMIKQYGLKSIFCFLVCEEFLLFCDDDC